MGNYKAHRYASYNYNCIIIRFSTRIFTPAGNTLHEQRSPLFHFFHHHIAIIALSLLYPRLLCMPYKSPRVIIACRSQKPNFSQTSLLSACINMWGSTVRLVLIVSLGPKYLIRARHCMTVEGSHCMIVPHHLR